MNKLIILLLFPILSFSQEIENELSLNLDGNHYITISQYSELNFMLTSSFTICTWIYLDDNTSNGTIYIRGDTGGTNGEENKFIWLSLDNNYKIAFSLRGDSENNHSSNVISNTSLTSGWYHITAIRDYNNTLKLFIHDGLMNLVSYDSDDDISEQIIFNYNPNHYLGADMDSEGGGSYFNGKIDNFSIWNNMLSNDEIELYVNCPPTGNEEEIIAYWTFEEGYNDNWENAEIVDEVNGYIGIINNNCCDTQVGYPEYSYEPSPNNCINNIELNSSFIIGDLNCDGVVNGIDAQILDSLIFQLQNPNQLAGIYPCLHDNLSGLSNESIQALQETVEALQNNINFDNNLLIQDLELGSMIFWNGNTWNTIPPGEDGSYLRIHNNTPFWYNSQLIELGEFGQPEIGGGMIAYIFQPGDEGYVAGEDHGLIVDINGHEQLSWFDAINYCDEYNYGGLNDWFLPNLNQMEWICETFDFDPYFPFNSGSSFWTSDSCSNGKYLYARQVMNVTCENPDYTRWVIPCRTF